MQVNGSCHCGAIRFLAEIDPAAVLVCHCTDCQTLSGTAFRTVVPTRPGSFRLLSGRLSTYVKTGDSGNRREQTFCPTCGTPVYSAPIAPEPRVLGLRVGALAERDQLVPRVQYWTRSHLHWLDGLGAMPALQTQPAFGAQGDVGAGTEDRAQEE